MPALSWSLYLADLAQYAGAIFASHAHCLLSIIVIVAICNRVACQRLGGYISVAVVSIGAAILALSKFLLHCTTAHEFDLTNEPISVAHSIIGVFVSVAP